MEEETQYSENAWTHLNLCCEPTFYEGLKFAKDLIIANVSLRLLIQYINLPHNVRHSLSFVIGSFLLYYNIGSALLWVVVLSVFSYAALIILSIFTRKKRGIIVAVGVILLLILTEIFTSNPKMWHQIRGIQMIVSMKIISVAIDLDRDVFKSILNPIEFGGYILCPANCILGPWISFQKYNHYLEIKYITGRWIKIILLNLCLSMLYLQLSNCIVPWYIDDNMPKWMTAYRDAQAFRMSHYFISSLSVVSMISAGFGLTNDCHTEIEVTKPLYTEIPRSLVQVVVYWNIPMHQWLKNYIFKTCQPYGHFLAILITYVVSSLLHGLNFQISAVLLSIGCFSYIEFNSRLKVSNALEVCCLANLCPKQCEHKYKRNSLLAVIINIIFSLFTIIHLAYLGVMFEASFSVQETGYSYLHTLKKWEDLNYFSHSFISMMYFINVLM